MPRFIKALLVLLAISLLLATGIIPTGADGFASWLVVGYTLLLAIACVITLLRSGSAKRE